jgi:hypothetical protein
LPQLIEYRDYADKADLKTVPDKDVTVYDMRNIQWRGTVRNDRPDSVVLRFSAVRLLSFDNDTKPMPFTDESLVFQVRRRNVCPF